MNEVAGRMIAHYAAVAEDCGLPLPDFVADLGLHPADLHTRVSWGAAVTLLVRMMGALGGMAQLEKAFVPVDRHAPDLVALARRLGPMSVVARFLNTKLAAANLNALRYELRELSSRRYDLRIVAREGYRSHPAIIASTVGVLRGQPLLLGLAEARVTWEGRPEDFVCHVTLPGSLSAQAHRRDLSAETRARAGAYLRSLVADRAHYHMGAQRLAGVVSALGLAAQRAEDSGDFARAVVRACCEELGHSFARLWINVGNERTLLASRGQPSGEPLVVALRAGEHEVGQLETDASAGRESAEAIGPLVAAVLRTRLSEERRRGSSCFPEEWRLTTRQRQVVNLLVLGQTNPAIAKALLCTVGTVEDHLTAIYAKAGVGGRQLLSARLLAFRRGSTPTASDGPNQPNAWWAPLS